MKCSTCGKEIEKNDICLVNNIGVTCYECYKEITAKYHITHPLSKDYTEHIVITIYAVAILIFIVGLIAGIIIGIPQLFYIWFVAFISGMLFIALGKIISLLKEIKDK